LTEYGIISDLVDKVDEPCIIFKCSDVSLPTEQLKQWQKLCKKEPQTKKKHRLFSVPGFKKKSHINIHDAKSNSSLLFI